MNVTGAPTCVGSWSSFTKIVVEPAWSCWVSRYVFAKPASPVTLTSKTQSAFMVLSRIGRQSRCAVRRSRGFADGVLGMTHGGFSGGQLRRVNVAVDVFGA